MQNFTLASALREGRASLPPAIFALIGTLILAVAVPLAAQDEPAGVDNGDYHYQGSVDLGYRFVNVHGSDPVYDTFVDEHQGPRLFEQALNIRSLNHDGLLFDNLFLSSFGWGGDPENASRLRVSKNKIYNFNMTFRRDRNFWDYNDLANPMNPPNPYIQVNDSPHAMETVRRMYDYSLILVPQSPVRVRLGYTRNDNEGPAFSTVHEGTDTILFQNTRTLLDAYRFGVDFRVLPRTNISYDQFLQYYRGDTSWIDNNFLFQLTNGTPVDAGIDYNAAAGQPCSNTPTPIFSAGTPPVLRSTCSAYQAYSRFAPLRISYPTEQLTLQSSYFRRVDVSLRGSYSNSEDRANNYDETFLGLGRGNLRGSDITGTASAARVAANLDAAATFRITDHLRLVDSFRFSNFRIPGIAGLNTLNLFPGASPATLLLPIVTYSAATCNPGTGAGCPVHSSSSAADLSSTTVTPFLGQDAKYNTVSVEYDFDHHYGASLGYRYGRRTISQDLVSSTAEVFYPTSALRGDCAAGTANGSGVCDFAATTVNPANSLQVNEHSGLFGFWAHPTERLRANLDVELFSADNAPMRISPRNLQHYKTRINYRPKNWLNLSGTVNIFESRNNVFDVNHREHNQNYGFTADITPKPRFGFDFGYNYDTIYSTTNICYVLTSTPPANSTLCTEGTPYISADSVYLNKINFAFANVMYKPVPRATWHLGYILTSSSGITPLLANPGADTSLGFNYHKPTAELDVNLGKGLFWRTAWAYFDYNEKYFSYPLPPRDFQSNNAVLALRYEF
ncbi:MAG TPA: hypothetical protein VND65_13425 [Candidatus Binatia bacterium]|nr:hypothetical protein [Candidatus Binatia bacterium]